MNDYEETIAAWEKAGADVSRRLAIHPSGFDEEAYELSGFMAARQIMRQFPPMKFPKIVDFGCGDGRVTRHLAGRYEVVDGIDTSPAMCRAGLAVAPHAFFWTWPELHSIENGLEPETWLRSSIMDAALVFSLAVFIHHTYADGRALLCLLAQMFPRATFALQIPIYEVAREPENWTDVGVWTEEMFFSAAKAAGLEIVRWGGNVGAFDYAHIGPNHDTLQVLKRIGT